MDPKITQLIKHLKSKPIKLDNIRELTLQEQDVLKWWIKVPHLGKCS